MARSAEARKVLQQLDEALARAGKAGGGTLQWSAQEQVVLGLISSTIDRKVGLGRAYSRCGDDVKLRVKLSAELRLLEAQLARLVKQVTPAAPAPVARRSQKARHAANVRWGQDGGGVSA